MTHILRRPSLLISGLLLATGAAPTSAQEPPADLVLTGGTIHTVDAARPQAEAVAVRDGRIVFVGSESEARALVGAGTRVVDLDAGAAVYPGFVDSHGHVPRLGASVRTVDLVGTRSLDEVVERVVRRARETPQGEWIQGRGWDQNEWGDTRFPHHGALSRAVPDHPAILTRVDGHAVFVNARAMELAGVDADTPDPQGGRIVRDPDTGEAIGVFVDRAMDLIREIVPAETPEQIAEAIRLASRELNRVGLTGAHDAGSSMDVVEIYEDVARSGGLTARMYVMVRDDADGLNRLFAMGPRRDVAGDGMLAVRAIKVSADGALGSRGAALLEDYSDEPGNRGLILVPAEELAPIARDALRTGFQLNVHAIGDRANRMVLDVFEEALAENPTPDHRFRVEHAQILHRHDIPRFAELGVIPSMQAIHQASDMYWAENRLGWTRIHGAYAWRSLLETGVVIPGGSDFPVESPDPLLSFHAAVTRQDADGWPAGGWLPAQAMTREEALRHLTIWPAYASFTEDELGSITPGKRADLTVFDRDLMTVPEDEILDARVVMTVVGGEVVYEGEEAVRADGGGR